MKKLLLSLVLLTPMAHAAEIIGTGPDNRVGEVFGSGVGVLLGGAAGGPIGALAGAAIGYFTGGGVQQVTGQTGVAYQVKLDDGSVSTMRYNRLPEELKNSLETSPRN